jgi:hypothetical protein
LCGCQFREEEAKAACKGCPLGGGCHMMRCPNCNYEIPEEPKLIKALKAWKERKNGIRGKG